MNFIEYKAVLRDRTNAKNIVYSADNTIVTISEPWNAIGNKFLRTLCHAHLSPRFNAKHKLPLHFIWFPLIFKKWFSNYENCCVLFSAQFYSLADDKAINYVKRRYKNCKIVLQFNDRFDFYRSQYRSMPSADRLLTKYDLVITYNTFDAEKYGFVLQRPIIESYKETTTSNSMAESDLFFIGSHKGRAKQLIRIFEKCSDLGIKCDFNIVEVPESEIKYPDQIQYNTRMNYEDVLRHVGATKCVLNLTQENGAGVTMRDSEALGNNKLLLTNNHSLQNTPLYLEEQIIWLQELEKRADEIKRGFAGKRNCSEEFSREKWYKWLENML